MSVSKAFSFWPLDCAAGCVDRKPRLFIEIEILESRQNQTLWYLLNSTTEEWQL